MTMRLKNALAAGLFLAMGAQVALAADFYVAPTGNDAAAGTKGKPFATVARARDAVREKIAAGMKADVVVEIAPGRYFHSEPIRFDERDGGRDGHAVIYRGSAREGVKLYGGQQATQWEKHKDDIWRAPIAKGKALYQLIVDDQPAVMARFPKFGDGYSMSWCEGGKVPEAWRGWDYTDAQIIGFLTPNWFGDTVKVTAVNPTTGQISTAGGSPYFGGMGARRYIRGLLGLLTEPGEWCPQRKEGYLYYWPAAGEPKDHVVVVPFLRRLLDVRGSAPDKPAQNIRFESLELIGADSWELLGNPPMGILDDGNAEAILRVENGRKIALAGCKVLGSGWVGVLFWHFAQDCEVSDCLINHSGYDGIAASGFNPGAPPFKTPMEADGNFGHKIYNNAILNSGQHSGHGAAIQFWQSGRNTVENNYIRRAPRYGISYNCWPWNKGDKIYGIEVTDENQHQFRYASGIVLRYNDVGLVCRDSSDFGALQCWWPGRDNVWEYNAVHDVHADVDWDGWAHGVHPDDGVDYWTMRGCVFYFLQGGNATGAWMLKGQHQVADNNVVADSRMNRGVTAEPYGRSVFDVTNTHNIFSCDVKDYYTGGGKEMVKEFDNNVFWPASPKVEGYRTWGAEKHSVCEDPQFVLKNKPWDRTWSDYDLKASSPALKLGFKPIPMDKIGLRTKEFPFDLGAIERRSARSKIQAEDNDRIYHARNQGSTHVYHIEPGAWLKFENIDFGKKAPKKIVASVEYPQGQKRYGADIVATPLRELPNENWRVIDRWEVSPSYKMAGKKGPELFDVAFEPETAPEKVAWKPFLKPTISKGGVVSPVGLADLDIINGEGQENSCAYLRASLYAEKAVPHQLPMIADQASGLKVWVNGKQVISENNAGRKANVVPIQAGWNTILVKVNQSDASYKPLTEGQGNFWCRLGFDQADQMGRALSVPGLPLEEKPAAAQAATGVAMEVRLDSVEGKVLGTFRHGQSEVDADARVTGVHNVYLVFPAEGVKSVNWFRFE
ncbi:MAG: right-handed parallel beta-helix repeat-containing protein [Planctomycetota bacterium]|nr:right-handed parallel beta-helix repeat-containing protein [Planctomycetota bacterium]